MWMLVAQLGSWAKKVQVCAFVHSANTASRFSEQIEARNVGKFHSTSACPIWAFHD
jgi:hypothetical protein